MSEDDDRGVTGAATTAPRRRGDRDAVRDGRIVHDADAHIMETPTWLRDHADPAIRDRIEPLRADERQRAAPDRRSRASSCATSTRRSTAPAPSTRRDEYRAVEADEIMLRKNFAATGSFLAEDRPRALDLLGFSSQLVFNTFHNRRLRDWEHGGDLDLAYGVARAHNRGMVEFCAVDPRLLPTCYVPLVDFDRAAAMADEAIAMGAAALLVASGCPPGHSPSHLALDPVWARAEEAGIPIVFHVGGTGDLIDPTYFHNGLPIPPDFHGGEENFRSVDYMGIPRPPAQTLATMIFDGVLDRFPSLRIGVIEQGAIWVPSWMRQMESAFDAFVRHEERLQALELRPTEYVRRQIRFTPYPTEDVGWIIEQAGPRCACSRPTTRTSKAAAGRSSGSRRRSASVGRRGAAAFLLRQLPRPHGHRRSRARKDGLMLLNGVNTSRSSPTTPRACVQFYRGVFDATVAARACTTTRWSLTFIDIGPVQRAQRVRDRRATPRRSGRRRCSNAAASTTSGCGPRRSTRSTRSASGLIERRSTDGFVTDFGPVLQPVLRRPRRPRG